jgi:hypothetical protein
VSRGMRCVLVAARPCPVKSSLCLSVPARPRITPFLLSTITLVTIHSNIDPDAPVQASAVTSVTKTSPSTARPWVGRCEHSRPRTARTLIPALLQAALSATGTCACGVWNLFVSRPTRTARRPHRPRSTLNSVSPSPRLSRELPGPAHGELPPPLYLRTRRSRRPCRGLRQVWARRGVHA